jgi:hypothetical protein
MTLPNLDFVPKYSFIETSVGLAPTVTFETEHGEFSFDLIRLGMDGALREFSILYNQHLKTVRRREDDNA